MTDQDGSSRQDLLSKQYSLERRKQINPHQEGSCLSFPFYISCYFLFGGSWELIG